MAIITLQRKGRELGRIRIGMQVTAANGKRRPTKLEAFRFTTPSRPVADAVASLLGGKVEQWKPDSGAAQWEVVTQATTLAVIVPPGEAVISQFYEMWSGGGCQRRCDGVTESLTQKPCLCSPDTEQRIADAAQGQACKPTTRLSVMLPDLPDIGVWRLESHGYYAAVELGGTAELLARARDAGTLLPATLRLEQRQVKRGGKTQSFAVPVLELGATLRELAEMDGHAGLNAALPPAPRRALEASSAVTNPPSVTAEELAAAAFAEDVDQDALRALWKQASTARLLDDLVADPDDILVPLGDLLTERVRQLTVAGLS